MEFNYGYYEYIDINKPYALFNYQIAGISPLLPSAAVLILIHYICASQYPTESILFYNKSIYQLQNEINANIMKCVGVCLSIDKDTSTSTELLYDHHSRDRDKS